MKTMKKIIMSLAAMLLVSIGAFAQSGTLEGDVNNDGVVDVADIVKIIDIMQNTQPQTTYYWYVGQTQPTSLDGLSPINEYTSPIEYTNTSGARGYVYILLHKSKSITSVIGKVSGGSGTFRIIDDTTIPDYNIWRTAALGDGSTWIITIE